MKKKIIVGTFSLLTSFFISSVISSNEADAAYYENVPHPADQWEYRTGWSGLINVHYKTLRYPRGYNRSYYARRPKTWHFPGHYKHYWVFSYRTW